MLQKKSIALGCIFFLMLLMGNSLRLNAQDSTEDHAPFLKISGNADVYYQFDPSGKPATSYTSFTHAYKSFALGMASLKLEHSGKKTGIVADLGFGPRAREFSYNEEGITSCIKQLYMTYSPTEWLDIAAGTWATHIGYEVLDANANRNYSMSYLFTYGPFSHTGIKATFKRKNHSLMAGVTNPTDFRMPQGFHKKSFIAQYHVDINKQSALWLNLVTGGDSDTSHLTQWDVVGTVKFSEKWGLALNSTFALSRSSEDKSLNRKEWWGSALYIYADPKPWIGIALRGEYFSDCAGWKIFSTSPSGGDVFSATLSVPLRVDQLTFIPEYRWEHASEDIFLPESGLGRQSRGSFLVAAVYAF